MGYDGQALGCRSRGMVSLTVVELAIKYEYPGFDGTEEKAMTTKITFVKVKDVVELAYSLEEKATVNENGQTLPLNPSCAILKRKSKIIFQRLG